MKVFLELVVFVLFGSSWCVYFQGDQCTSTELNPQGKKNKRS